MCCVNAVKMTNFLYALVLVFSVLQMSTGSTNSTFRKHKVHNIVLYPDKHSWCTSTPIKQVVSDVNCDSVEIDNRVCLGACFSYSIPRTIPANNNGNEINSYCDSCQPINTSWIPVQLTCGDGWNQTKHVQLINECRCSSCSRHWEFESPPPVIDVAAADYVEETSTETSRYSELMKLKQDENAEDEEDNNDDATTDVSNTAAEEILQQNAATVNSTRLEKDVWIQGPHHSKVLLKKEAVSENIANEETQQYL